MKTRISIVLGCSLAALAAGPFVIDKTDPGAAGMNPARLARIPARMKEFVAAGQDCRRGDPGRPAWTRRQPRSGRVSGPRKQDPHAYRHHLPAGVGHQAGHLRRHHDSGGRGPSLADRFRREVPAGIQGPEAESLWNPRGLQLRTGYTVPSGQHPRPDDAHLGAAGRGAGTRGAAQHAGRERRRRFPGNPAVRTGDGMELQQYRDRRARPHHRGRDRAALRPLPGRENLPAA